MKNMGIKITGTVLGAIALTMVCLYFLPVKMTLLEILPSQPMAPFGPITKQNPLELCLSELTPLGLENDLDLELMLATYNRTNTSHYSFLVSYLQNGKMYEMGKFSFEAAGVIDNGYKSFPIESEGAKEIRPCLKLESPDATPENALTTWLSATSEPVLKITATVNLLELINHLTSRNYFSAGKEVLLGLFFICLLVQFIFIGYILIKPDERK